MNWQLEPENSEQCLFEGLKILVRPEGELSSHTRKDRFNKDQLCQLLADGQPSIADLADKIVPAGYQADDLVFAETDFAEAILNLGRGAKLFDADSDACLDTA